MFAAAVAVSVRCVSAGHDQEPFSFVATNSGRWGFVNNTASATVFDLDRYVPAGNVSVGATHRSRVHPGRKPYVSCEGSHEPSKRASKRNARLYGDMGRRRGALGGAYAASLPYSSFTIRPPRL
jgi:hypothetical protein